MPKKVPRSADELAAVDLEHLAGDVAGEGRCRKEEVRRCAVLRGSQSLQGNGLAGLLQLIRRRVPLVKVSFDRSRRHAVDANAVGRELLASALE